MIKVDWSFLVAVISVMVVYAIALDFLTALATDIYRLFF